MPAGVMRAVEFQGNGRAAVLERPIPEVKNPDDVLLRVQAVGVCGTDVHILSVPPGQEASEGVILGHEYTGEVVEVGNGVRSVSVGDRVVVDPTVRCGYCNFCKDGLTNMCQNLTALGIFIDGGFAEYNIAPESNLHQVPDHMLPERAAFAEPLACVVNARNQLRPQAGESVAILGAGPIGQLFTQVLGAEGVRPIIVSEPSEFRREYAKRSGAHRVVNPLEESLEAAVQKETGRGADIVVDAVGSLFPQTLQVARTGGRVMLFGQNTEAHAEITQNDITQRCLTVIGSWITNYTFPTAIRLLDSGALRVEELITHEFGLNEFDQAIDLLREGQAIKILLRP
ncbi:MAG: alcohol dehydrogenase catalytic domain-containing protein [Candidatus Bipolaricaulia bacterium]